jgi:ABC-type sugar transport system ATPase subunit
MPAIDLLRVESVSKRFGPVQALSEVSFSVGHGEIVGLAGENGAGKSTLIKILAGIHAADQGAAHLDGKPYAPRDSNAAVRAGLAVFHQEIPVCPHLSITANIFLGTKMPKKYFMPDWRTMEARCVELYRVLLDEDVNPQAMIRDVSAAERQLALLVRVLSRDAKLIILDEPTTALTPPEVARLFRVIRNLREKGISFIFVSHMLEELIDLSDRIVVLRDGKHIGTLAREEFSAGVLSKMIAGRTITPPARVIANGKQQVVLRADNLSVKGHFSEVSFSLHAGEILGVAGLTGSGRSVLLRSLFGLHPVKSGEVTLNNRSVRVRSPYDAIRWGIGYVPEDRKMMGLFPHQDIKTNLCIARTARRADLSSKNLSGMRRDAASMKEELSIKFRNEDDPIGALSGGNQQKVLLSRWLLLEPAIILMNEPTRGVDVGAKKEIYDLLFTLTARGFSFIITSPAIEELLIFSDRVLVMNRGKVRTIFSRDEATKEAVIHAATT